MSGFTEKELSIAKSVDLVDVARSMGYTPRKLGRYYTLKEMDSVRIYNRTNWYRWSTKTGGSQIDFLKEFNGLDVKEAVAWLLDFSGYKRNSSIAMQHQARMEEKNEAEKKNFILPEKSESNEKIRDYLNRRRGISIETIDFFIQKGLVYESKDYHNVIFLGKDSEGKVRFASMRGTYDREGRKPFKCDVTGNDKNYGFNLYTGSDRIIVFEGAIDLMSYLDVFSDNESNLLALGMVSDAPLKRYLEDHSEIRRIIFCLDNDEPGRNAAAELMAKYKNLGYQADRLAFPSEYKDMNEWLIAKRKSMRGRTIRSSQKK